jgi:hypothetical protein
MDSPRNRNLEQLLASLTPWQAETVLLALRNPIWQPQSIPQWLALLSEADELFYGGQAGGGKTDLLLGLACTQHRRSIIFRREFAQLGGTTGLIERSREVLGDVAAFNGQNNTWRGIPGGRMLEFGAAQYAGDVTKYKGRPHDFYGFDELPEFLEAQYRFLIAWARTTIPGQRVRVVSGGNPPTHSDGEWVISYWGPWLDDRHPHPAKPGELRWYAVVDGKDVEREDGAMFTYKGEELKPKSRTFIPACLADNAYLRDTDYAMVLQNTPEPLRSQLLYGSFTAGMVDNPWQVIPTEWVKVAQARWTPEPPGPMTHLGVDVARGGNDQTVLAPRHLRWYAPLLKYPGSTTPDGQRAAGLVLAACAVGAPQVNVDVIGVGSSVYDQLAGKLPVAGVNFGAGTAATDRSGHIAMRNVRAAAYWGMREALDPVTGLGLALPPDSELLADLTAPRWSLSGGALTVESKEDIVKRLGRSPDCGDAVVLALYEALDFSLGFA